MTEREELVERVARAICRGHSHAPEGTCAALCMDQLGDAPKNGCRHAVRIHGISARAAIAECERDRAELEAQCAAMRAGLEQLKSLGEEGMKPDYSEWLTFHDKVAQVAGETLSPDAGRKVLDALRAAKNALIAEDGEAEEAMKGLERAISTLGWEP